MSQSPFISDQMKDLMQKLELSPIINLHNNILIIVTSKKDQLGKSFYAVVHFLKLYKSFYSSYEVLEKYIYKLQNDNSNFHQFLNRLEASSGGLVGFFSLLVEPIQRYACFYFWRAARSAPLINFELFFFF